MDKIGISAPRTIRKGNFMECTRTIHPTSVMNGLKEIIGRDKTTERSGPNIQGMVETQLEILEVEKS